MTHIEFIGWVVVIIGIIVNTGINIARNKRNAQNQQIVIDELEALRKELNDRKKD